MLAWIDLEMTGLDPARHAIVEIASLVTDDDLTLIEEGPDLVVHATPDQLAQMDDVVACHAHPLGPADRHRGLHPHRGRGRASRRSPSSSSTSPSPAPCPLAGNSIGTDRRFLAALLPEVEDFLHYRSVDVSTIKELCRRWRPDVYKAAPDQEGRPSRPAGHPRERRRARLLPGRDLRGPHGDRAPTRRRRHDHHR